MACRLQEHDIRLEASMLPHHVVKGLKGTSEKTRSTASGSQSSGERHLRGPRSANGSQSSGERLRGPRSGGGSVSDDCCSSENGSAQEEDIDARRRLQTGLQNAEAPTIQGDEKQPIERETEDDQQSTVDGGPMFASIFSDGPAYSIGGANHPLDCHPCVHFCFSKRRGCNSGDDFNFCHNFHESKLQQKRQRWKGNKKSLVRLPKDQVTEIEIEIEGGQVMKQAALDQVNGVHQAPVPKVAYHGESVVPKLAYTIHPVGHLADPMTIVPSSVGPHAGVAQSVSKVSPCARALPAPPPGLEQFAYPRTAFVSA